jgi:cytochrome c553
MRLFFQLATVLLSGLAASTAFSQDANTLHQRALAANCSNCHGTEGRAVEGSAVPGLAGQPRDYIITQMKSFKDGTRQATVMHQLAKGFTDQQIESIASYFAATKR